MLRTTSFVGILCLLTAAAGWSQDTRGTITGKITDPSGAVIPAASVVVTNYGYRVTGFVRDCSPNGRGIAQVSLRLTGAANLTTMTDTNGSYVFTNLPIGPYMLTPTQPGI